MDTNATSSDMPGTNLTADSLRDVLQRCRMFPLESWRALVVSPEVQRVLVSQISASAGHPRNCLFGLDVWEKPGQIIPCWRFKDRQLALDYLRGKVSEFDLINRPDVDQKDGSGLL